MGAMNITNSFDVPASKLVLRQMAEKLVNGEEKLSEATLAAMPPTLVLKMLHDLQVHEVELEMQNETLRQTQLQLLAMQARYFDLYDLAPISYCTVNELGIILEANLAMAELLGVARNIAVGQRISNYILRECQDTYYLCRKLLNTTGQRQSCELHMVKADGNSFWVNIAISSAESSNGDKMQRMVLTDITDAKIMAAAMHESESRLRAIVETHG
jgi:PAS domain S-box-containing protein